MVLVDRGIPSVGKRRARSIDVAHDNSAEAGAGAVSRRGEDLLNSKDQKTKRTNPDPRYEGNYYHISVG